MVVYRWSRNITHDWEDSEEWIYGIWGPLLLASSIVGCIYREFHVLILHDLVLLYAFATHEEDNILFYSIFKGWMNFY